MKNCFLLLLASAIIAGSSFLANAQEKWELAKEEDGISVYTKDTEGSKIKSYRTKATIHCQLENLIPVYFDAEGFTEWTYSCIESKEIYKSTDTVVYYSVYEMPFPFKDRDLVARRVMTVNEDGSVVMSTYEAPGYLKEKEKLIRIPGYKEITTLIPGKEGIIEVTSEGFFDPGGSLPSWLLNMFIADGPIKSFKMLQEVAANKNK